MDIHVGKIIEQKFQESGIKLSVFAERINTGERNVYSIFKRKDINAGMLKDISEVLDFNFFDLYVPKTHALDIPAEPSIRISLELSIPKKELAVLPRFLTQISEMGSKLGINVL